MKKVILFLLLAIAGVKATAQVMFQKVYNRTSDNTGYVVKQTSDNGFIISGTTIVTSPSGEMFLIKTGASGDTLWTRTYNIGGEGRDVLQTPDGGFLLTGTIYDTLGLGTNLFVLKTDAVGTPLWSKRYSGPQQDIVVSIKQTADGNFALCGYTSSFGTPINKIFLLKLDVNGNLIWQKIYGGNNTLAHSFQETNDGGFIITGEKTLAGTQEMYLLKTDNNGLVQWANTYSGNYGGTGNCVCQTSDGGFIVCGVTMQIVGILVANPQSYFVKTDMNGNLQWSKKFGTWQGNDYSSSVKQTADNGYVLTGSTSSYFASGFTESNIYIIKTDSNGHTKWSNIYGTNGHELARNLEINSDGGYSIMGDYNDWLQGGHYVYLIKTDSLGNSGCHQIAIPIADSVYSSVVTPIIQSDSSVVFSVSSPSTILGGGFMQTIFCSSIHEGINEINNETDIFISPNPATSSITISSSDKIKEIKVMNILGEIVSSHKATGTNEKIDISGVAKGIYFVQLQTEKGIVNKKIVKQ